MIRMSTRARYALRAMIELAAGPSDGPLQLHAIAEDQHLSLKYLEQIIRPLRLAGLVISERGSTGGYRLGRQASQITALDVVEAVEGPLSVVDCARRPEICRRSSGCVARNLWCDVGRAIGRTLSAVTLAELVRRQQGAAGAKLRPAGRRPRRARA